MDWRRLADQLETSGGVLVDLFADADDAEVRWKPAPERWSMLEVLAHLWDEEKDDFRRRLTLTLEDPGREWPPIDPQRWVRERRYNERDLAEALAGFRRERAASLSWLRGLSQTGLAEPAWDRQHEHASVGSLRAGDLLASWVAHDYLHLRQIATLRIEYLAVKAAPYSTRYATP